MLTRRPLTLNRTDPLVPSQVLNPPKTRSRTIARPAFLLHILKFQSNEILWVPQLGAPTITQQPDLTILELDT
jgi:hypothetical protein